MKLSGLLVIALIISINVLSIGNLEKSKTITKDVYISLNKEFNNIHKEIIWQNDFTEVNNWDSQNFLLLNTDEVKIVTVGNEKINFSNKSKYNNISGKCIVSTDFDTHQDIKSKLTLKEGIDISEFTNIDLRFSQIYRPIKDSRTFVLFSTDGGDMWTKIEINKKISNNMEVINNVIIDISWLVKNEDNLLIRFESNSNDLSWIIDNIELQGLTTLLPEILTVTPDNGNQGESLSIALSGQFTHFIQGSETVWFEQASQTIFSGSNIIVTSLTNMNFNIDIPLTAPQGLYDVKVQNLTDGTITKTNGFEVTPAPAPNWTFTNTGIFHQILIPSFASVTIDGSLINPGDYIGVFYDSLGTQACAGFMLWINTSIYINAAGDDPFTTDKDGFDISEEFTWVIWDASSNTEYPALANYQLSGFPNSNLFAMNGNSGISSLEAFTYQTQSITLAQGWDIYSTYINPPDPSLESIFAQAVNNLLIVKNGAGQVYWPPYVNLIGSISMGEGYQINMASQNILDITGAAVVPELTPINIPFGWSILGYLRQSPGNAATMMSSIVNDIVIVKDGWGSVYWPAWGINNIGNFVPGGGYQIRTSNAVTFYYPSNTQTSKSVDYISTYSLDHYSYPINTGSNMTLCIPLTAWEETPLPGDEIGVFNKIGELTGCAVFENENLAITIWGGENYTMNKSEFLDDSKSFKLVLYSNSEGIETNLNISSWIEGGSFYVKDGLSVIEKISSNSSILKLQNSPNPCINSTTISFELEHDTRVEINIYNEIGKHIISVVNTNLLAGIHNIEVDVTNLEAGIYFYGLSTNNQLVSNQMLVIK